MAITLTTAYLEELNKKGENIPDIILELALSFDSFLADGTYLADGSITASGSEGAGVIKWGYNKNRLFSDVKPILKSVSSVQNELDPKTGYSTRGQITAVITGRDNFKDIIADEFLKNKRVIKKEGFIADGFLYSDYAETFTGKIIDWSRKGDELTLIIADDMHVEGTKKIPVAEEGNTQTLNFQNMNPVDIIKALLEDHMGILPSLIDDAAFDFERDTWLSGWKFDRVLTEPQEANKLLNELQLETNSFIIHDGEKISFKHFAPPIPGQNIEEWDEGVINEDSFSQKSGYIDQFFNRIEIYFNYDESGNNKDENFQTVYIVTDANSISDPEWGETKTKTIKSKSMRSFTYSQPTQITGITIYHVSVDNSTGDGELVYNSTNNTLTWEPPGGGGIPGAAITLDKDGTYQLFHTNLNKWIRVVVDVSALPVSDKIDVITISTLDSLNHATYLANKLLARFRDPASIVELSVDLRNVAFEAVFIKPTDLKDFTTDEAVEKGKSSWIQERMMIYSVRPNDNNIAIKAVQTRMFKRYGFIAPASQPDWDAASEAEKEYAYIGDAAANQLGTANDEGVVIW